MPLTPEQQETHDEIYRHARSTARRWGVPLEDLVQEGWVKALKIREKWTPDRGPWKTYLGFCIHQTLVTYAAQARVIVNLPKWGPAPTLRANPNLARTKSIVPARTSHISPNDNRHEMLEEAEPPNLEEYVYAQQLLSLSDDLFGEGTSERLRAHMLAGAPLPKDLQHKFRQARQGNIARKVRRKLH